MTHHRVTSFTLWRGFRGRVSYPRLKPRKTKPHFCCVCSLGRVKRESRQKSGGDLTALVWCIWSCRCPSKERQMVAGGTRQPLGNGTLKAFCWGAILTLHSLSTLTLKVLLSSPNWKATAFWYMTTGMIICVFCFSGPLPGPAVCISFFFLASQDVGS